jgi:hypothetical protein
MRLSTTYLLPFLQQKRVNAKAKNDDSGADPLHYSATTKDLQKLAEMVASSALTVSKSVLNKAVTSWFLDQGEMHVHSVLHLVELR